MPVIETMLDPRDAGFVANRSALETLVADLKSKVRAIEQGGGDVARGRHTGRGKLLPRDRVGTLLDPGSPFLELSQLAAYGMYDDNIAAAGIITGIGRVSGRECVIVCNDATVKGGTYYPMTVKKHLRAQEIARENRLPCIYLVDSGGANLPNQTDVFPDRDHFGRIFFNQATMSAEGIPQIAVVMGSCTAGGAYVPAMSDESIIVARARDDLPGRAAAGEGGDRRDRQRRRAGRRRRAHADLRRRRPLRAERRACALDRAPHRRQPQSGQARAARRRGRRATRSTPPTRSMASSTPTSRSPTMSTRSSPGSSTAASSTSSRRATARRWSPASRACPAIWSGIVANNGVLYSESAKKGAHFIELCSQRGTPLIFLQNITGFMVGRKYEAGGIASDGAKMVTAVSCASVPKFTVIIGGSYGAGQLRHVRPRVQSALPLDVAERAHFGDGRRAGRDGAGDDTARCDRSQGRRLERRRGGSVQGAAPRAIRAGRPSVLRQRPAVGRRRDRPRRYAQGSRACDLGGLESPDRADAFGVFRM